MLRYPCYSQLQLVIAYIITRYNNSNLALIGSLWIVIFFSISVNRCNRMEQEPCSISILLYPFPLSRRDNSFLELPRGMKGRGSILKFGLDEKKKKEKKKRIGFPWIHHWISTRRHARRTLGLEVVTREKEAKWLLTCGIPR